MIAIDQYYSEHIAHIAFAVMMYLEKVYLLVVYPPDLSRKVSAFLSDLHEGL